MEEKTILEKIKEILKDNEIIYTRLVPIINFSKFNFFNFRGRN